MEIHVADFYAVDGGLDMVLPIPEKTMDPGEIRNVIICLPNELLE